jgi:hypothetical protein
MLAKPIFPIKYFRPNAVSLLCSKWKQVGHALANHQHKSFLNIYLSNQDEEKNRTLVLHG